MKKIRIFTTLVLIATMLLGGSYQSQAAVSERYFPETGHSIVGAFKSYWEQHGGLERFGYPLSDELAEVSDLNGQTYTVQYFERAEFEHHPENAAPYDVLLTQLGTMRYHQLYQTPPPTEHISTDSPTMFPQTGKHVGRLLLNAWQRLGGLASVGYPISEELAEQSPLDGRVYMVQYFERTEFEYHPENTAPYDVLVTQLGRFAYNAKYNAPIPTPTPLPNAVQFPITQVADNPVIAGHYIFWIHFNPQDYQGVLDNEQKSAIYGHDLNSKQQFLVTNEQGFKYTLTSDGTTLAWMEISQPNHNKIQGFDTRTGQTFTILDIGDAVSDSMALDGGVLYYTGNTGLNAYDLATKQSRLIDKAGAYPVAKDGALLWEESQFTGQSSAPIISLHLLTAESERIDNILTNQDYCFSGYTLIKGSPVFAYAGNSFDCPPSERGLYLYNVTTGRPRTLSSTSAGGADASDNLIVWLDEANNTTSFGSINIYNVDTKVNRTVVKDSQREIGTFDLSGNTLIYTLDDRAVNGGYGRWQIYTVDLSVPTPPPSASAAVLLGTGISSSPPAVAGHSLFWLGSGCGFCGYDVDKQELYTVTNRPGSKVGITGNGNVLAWLETSPTSRGDIHTYDQIFRTEKIIMYADGYNITDYAVDGNFIYYRGTVKGQPGIYKRDITDAIDTLLMPIDGVGKLIAADGTFVWSEVKSDVTTLHLLRSDGSKGDTAIASVQGNIGFYGVSGDNVVWVEPPNSSTLNHKIHLYNISSGNDKVIASGNVDRSVINGNRVAWITLQGNPKPWTVTAYNIDDGASAIVASGDQTAITDIALAGENALAYTVDVGLTSNELYLVSLK